MTALDDLKPLCMDADHRKSFEDRYAQLVGHEEWPRYGWYNDKDFCRCYATAMRLADENERLIQELIVAREARDAADQQLHPPQ